VAQFLKLQTNKKSDLLDSELSSQNNQQRYKKTKTILLSPKKIKEEEIYHQQT